MLKQRKQFLDYVATNNKEILTYHTSNMILDVHSNASYLSEPKACSRVGEFFLLSTDMTFSPNNGMIHSTAQIIKNVMSSVVETELGALYINSKFTEQIQHTLPAMGHLQPPPCPWKLTTPPYMELYPIKSSTRPPKLWICTFTSSKIEKSNNHSNFIDVWKKQTMLITGWSTIQQHTIDKCARYS